MSQINKIYNTLKAGTLNIVNTFKIGGTEVTSTAAELNILDGVTATAAELNLNDNQVSGATFVIGSEVSNEITVSIQFTDAAGADMATRVAVPFYLSSDANGDDSTAATTSLAAGTDGHIMTLLADTEGIVVSEADGDADITIGDAGGAATYYLVLVMPNGGLVVSGAITFA